MTQRPITLLAVDDEPLNLEVIEEYLEGNNYRIVLADSGDAAWEKLQADPEGYDAVILDRMMPGMDGMEVLRRIKQDPQLKLLPVIMQTAATSPSQMAEGLEAGAYYYLAKPFDPLVMRTVVATALREHFEHDVEMQDAESRLHALAMLDEAALTLHTREEARMAALLLSSLCPSPQVVQMGLLELMLNAVEHGNLGITYEEKTQLIATARLQEEIARRQALPEFADKVVIVSFKRKGSKLVFNIADQGRGFDWRPYLEMRLDRMMDNHGRGIAMSRSVAFTNLQYLGRGNEVEATVIVDSV